MVDVGYCDFIMDPPSFFVIRAVRLSLQKPLSSVASEDVLYCPDCCPNLVNYFFLKIKDNVNIYLSSWRSDVNSVILY